jgi:hypothetical protein
MFNGDEMKDNDRSTELAKWAAGLSTVSLNSHLDLHIRMIAAMQAELMLRKRERAKKPKPANCSVAQLSAGIS